MRAFVQWLNNPAGAGAAPVDDLIIRNKRETAKWLEEEYRDRPGDSLDRLLVGAEATRQDIEAARTRALSLRVQLIDLSCRHSYADTARAIADRIQSRHRCGIDDVRLLSSEFGLWREGGDLVGAAYMTYEPPDGSTEGGSFGLTTQLFRSGEIWAGVEVLGISASIALLLARGSEGDLPIDELLHVQDRVARISARIRDAFEDRYGFQSDPIVSVWCAEAELDESREMLFTCEVRQQLDQDVVGIDVVRVIESSKGAVHVAIDKQW